MCSFFCNFTNFLLPTLTHIDEAVEQQTFPPTPTPTPTPSPPPQKLDLFAKMQASDPSNLPSPPSPQLSHWEKIYYDLLKQQRHHDYSIGWVYYQLKELNPPLFIWQKYAHLRSYHRQWATHQFESLNPPSPLSPEILQQIWLQVLQELPPLTQGLFKIHTHFKGLYTHWATIEVKHRQLLRCCEDKRTQIESALTHVFQHPIHVQFTFAPTPTKIIGRPIVNNENEDDLDF